MGLLIFLIFVWLVVMSYNVHTLKKRLWTLEKQLKDQAVASSAAQASTPQAAPDAAQNGSVDPASAAFVDNPLEQAFIAQDAPAPAASTKQEPAPSPVARPAYSEEPLTSASPLMSFVRRNAFAVAGIILLLLGFAYLLSSIEWGNLLPPMAKVGLVWLASAGMAGLGIKLGRRNALWGQIVQGGAAGVAYLSTYVAAARFSILAEPIALAGFALISGWTVYRALKEDSKMLAAVGFLGAYAAPVLALTANASLGLTLTYGLITTAAALWISLRRKWIELSVHAHVCAAGMATLVYSQGHDSLAPVLQQGLLNAYFVQFTAWVVAWSASGKSSPKEASALAACAGLSAVSYLGLQYWLLTPTTFSLVAMGIALAIGVALMRWPNVLEKSTKEAFWLVAALFGASAISGADSTKGFRGLALCAEAALMMLTATPDSRVRVWFARLLALIGIGGVLVSNSAWINSLALLGSLFLSLALANAGRGRDAWAVSILGAASLVGAAEAFSDLTAGSTSYWIKEKLVLTTNWLIGLGAVASGAAAVLASRTKSWNQAKAYYVALAGFWVLGASLRLNSAEITATGIIQLVLLTTLPLLGLGAIRVLSTDASSKKNGNTQVALSLVCAVLPAIVAYNLAAAPLVFFNALVLGLAGWVLLSRYVFEPNQVFGATTIEKTSQRVVEHVALVALLLSFIPYGPRAWTSAAGAMSLLISTLVAVGAWSTSRATQTATVRWTVGAFIGSLLLLLWSYALPVASLRGVGGRAFTEMPLPMIWGVLGVSLLVYFSRKGDRAGWQVAAAGCALATVKLLLVVGNALLSPLGVSLGLLGMGGLLLLAGYIAPQPPAVTEEDDVK